MSSLPSLSEGEILSQFYRYSIDLSKYKSHGEILERRGVRQLLVPSAKLRDSEVGEEKHSSSDDPSTSSGQISSEGIMVSVLNPGMGRPLFLTKANRLDETSLDSSMLDSEAQNSGAQHTFGDISVTLERISIIESTEMELSQDGN